MGGGGGGGGGGETHTREPWGTAVGYDLGNCVSG